MALSVVESMRAHYGPAPPAFVDRLADVSPDDVAGALEEIGLDGEASRECAEHWDGFRGDLEWANLVGAVWASVERDRGRIDEPLPIWPDLDDAGTNGRLFYLYLYALAGAGTREFLEEAGTPPDVVADTLADVVAHCATHRRKSGTVGVDAGWWMLLSLRGELVQVESLQFHRFHLGVGTLSPAPWYDESEAASRGPGFRRGDEAVGLHIPRGTNLAPAALDSTLARARDVLGALWPTRQRRLATCQTWMLDDRLRAHLDPSTNLLRFQDRFTLLAGWREVDEDVADFIFERSLSSLPSVTALTRLQRAVLEVLGGGEHWRARIGWFDFDGPAGSDAPL